MGDVVRIDSMQTQGIDYADMTFRINDIAAHADKAMPIEKVSGLFSD